MPATPPNPSAAPPPGERPGELLDRFLARLIDAILLFVVTAIVVGVVVVGALMGSGGGNVYLNTGTTYAAAAVSTVLGVVINLGYFAFMESSRGQTVGKMAMKLHVRGPQGQNPSFEESVRRNIFLAFALAGLVPIIGGLVGGIAQLVGAIMIAVGIQQDTARRQAWHDRFAGGTYVVKAG